MARLSHYAPGEYRPIAMKFDGITGGFVREHTSAGQMIYALGRFRIPRFYGPSFVNGYRTICLGYGDGVTQLAHKMHVLVCSGSRTNQKENYRLTITARNSAGTTMLTLFSKAEVADNAWHSFLVSWNATTGAFVFKLDGVDADDTTQTGRVLITGTMANAASSHVYVGQNQVAIGPVANNWWEGEISHLGYGEGYLTNWDDFFFPNNLPKRLDHVGFTEFGNGVFAPPKVQFDGTTGWYSKAYTSSTQAFTVVLGFNALPLIGTTRRVFRIESPAGYSTGSLEIYASDHATAPGKLVFYSANSVNSAIFSCNTSLSFDDGLDHLVFFSFSAATGLYTVIVDGRVPEFSALPTAIISTFGVGADSGVGVGALESGSQKYNGQLNFFGYRDVYMTNWQDFMTHDGKPREIDEGTWRQWRTQPLLWHKAAQMEESTGSLGPMVKNGTITYVPGSQPLVYHPYCDLENNLGSLGRMRRSGLSAPVVSDVLVRGTRYAPQNNGGVVLHFTNPRAVNSNILFDRSHFQQLDSSVPSSAISRNLGWAVDANGYASKAGAWMEWVGVLGLPAKATTTRMHQLVFRHETGTPSGTNPGVSIRFNQLDAINFWAISNYWTGGGWQLDMGEYVAGVWTSRATLLSSSVTNPIQGVMTVFDNGDSLDGFVTMFNPTTPSTRYTGQINWTAVGRVLKTATGVHACNTETPGLNMRHRSLLVMDI